MKSPLVCICGLVLAMSAVASPRAQGAVLIVTNTQDSGNGSLRATIGDATAGDTIKFNIPTSDPGYDPLNRLFTITLTSGEIVIQSDLTIENASGTKIAVSGNQASRILRIVSGTVVISNLSFINGKARGANAGGDPENLNGHPGIGGAILNQGTLTCVRCAFIDNLAAGGIASGWYLGPGRGGDGRGGAIANDGALSLLACTLTSNTGLGGQGGAYWSGGQEGGGEGGTGSGGALYNSETGTLTLTNCTISGNRAEGPDGINYNQIHGSLGANAQGGGIANLGSVTIEHCTLSNNASLGGDAYRGLHSNAAGDSAGGALYGSPESVATVRDTILAGNTVMGGAFLDPGGPPLSYGAALGPDVNAVVTSQGHNVLGRSDGCSGFVYTDIQGGTTPETALDAKLGPLAQNGGVTQTMALLPESPAIDTGDPAVLTKDQRYFLRNGPPDVGAFEYQGTQPVMLANISTRLLVGTGDNAMIGGFVITGTQPKTVIVRGIGPSLPLADALLDPVIEVHGGSGELLAFNDDWRTATSSQEIIGCGLPPTNEAEAALWGTINPGPYSVIVKGKNDATGIALFEVYDLDQTVDSKLTNVSTRGFVEVGNNVMIGGTIIVGSAPRVLFRAVGPSLSNFGVPEALGDPTMELYDGNGVVIAMNDNWRDDQESEIIATGIPPSNNLESAIVRDLAPGPYTAVVRGKNFTAGVGLIEVYDLN